jgi:hypothetical protein
MLLSVFGGAMTKSTAQSINTNRDSDTYVNESAAATKAQRPAHWRENHDSGFEGREALLGQAMNMVIKTLNQTLPYQHHVNDALIKAHLGAIQFAKDNDLLDQYIEHDRKMMKPINARIRKLIEQTGNNELALEAAFDITECHYQLVLETLVEPGKRTWKSPFKGNLDACVRIGQMDITEEQIHECWTKPRLLAYAEDMGVEFCVSDLASDGTITCEVI